MIAERLSLVLLSSYVSRGISILLPLIITPIIIKKLGIGLYSLVGIFAFIQSAISFLDLGIVPSLVREISSLRARNSPVIELLNTFRTIELVYYALAIIAFFVGLIASIAIAYFWMQDNIITAFDTAVYFAVMCVGATASFTTGIYSAGLIAMGHQLKLNIVSSLVSMIGAVISIIGLLFFSWNLFNFVSWQAILSCLSFTIIRFLAWKSMPTDINRPVYKKSVLVTLHRFAAGMSITQLLSIVSMNMDRILLAKLLPADIFGYYALSSTISSSLMGFVHPITAVANPRLTLAFQSPDKKPAIEQYHFYSQMVCVVIAPIVLSVVIFAEPVLQAWTGNTQVVFYAAHPLQILSLGWLFNSLMNIPYATQIAHGWVRLGLFGLIASLVFQIPILLYFVPRYGIDAGAWSWLVMELLFFLIAIPIMHRKILIGEALEWYWRDTILPVLAVLFIVTNSYFLFRYLKLDSGSGQATIFLYLAITILSSFLAALTVTQRLRPLAIRTIKKIIFK